MSVLYEFGVGQGALLGDAPGDTGFHRGLDGAVHDRAYQQQPTSRNNFKAFQAAKLTGGALSAEGVTAADIVRLVNERLQRRIYDVVFIDELRPTFAGDGAGALRDAMRVLARQAPIQNGDDTATVHENRARQVHIYVPAPELAASDPAGWEAAWEAMALSGGVWLESYRKRPGNRLVWRPEEWLSYSRIFSSAFAAAGGEPSRLHFLMTSPERAAAPPFGAALPGEPVTQAEQWTWARTGPACAILANGPGTWRVAADAVDKSAIDADARAQPFLSQYRAVFGNGPAPAGPADISGSCIPERIPAAERVGAAADALGVAGPVPATVSSDAPLISGAPGGPVRIDLGRDPGGIAAMLGVDPVDFWFSPRNRPAAQVVMRDAEGQFGVARVGGLGRATIPAFTPARGGTATFNLTIPGWKFHAAVADAPIDFAKALEPHRARLGDALVDRIARRPNEWRLIIPVAATLEIASPGEVAGSPPPVPTVDAMRLLNLPVEAVRRRWRLDPRRYAVTRVVATRGGAPASGAVVTVRGPGERIRRITLPANGVAFVSARRGGGALVLSAPGLTQSLRHQLPPRIVAAAIGVRELGAAAIRRDGRDPRKWRRIALLVKARGGGVVPFQGVTVRFGPRGLRRTLTDARGRARVWIPRAAKGRLLVRTADGRTVIVRRRLR